MIETCKKDQYNDVNGRTVSRRQVFNNSMGWIVDGNLECQLSYLSGYIATKTSKSNVNIIRSTKQ